MKKLFIILIVCLATVLMFGLGTAMAAKAAPGADPCIACHDSVTPGIVKQWHDSKHSQVGVKCYVCHEAHKGDPSGYNHNGYTITAVPSPKYCESCHAQEVAEYTNSKHAWAAFIGPLKGYYLKAKSMGLDPTAQSTAKKLKPVEMAKRTLSPLYPTSGILKKVGLLDDPDYNHNNVTLGCLECHGSFMEAGKNGDLKGWPNSGVGRINPDGSLGACTSCHTRHTFSIAEARKPETCGQCHLGPDHPQIEIYTESKHGNIYGASGDKWNWDVPPGQWGPRDIVAPTCATCHMSAFGGVKGSHDAGARLYWELQAPKSVPQWKSPEQSKDYIAKFEPDEELAKGHRVQMKKICNLCHSTRWTDNYFTEFDKVVSDYNMVWYKADTMLKDAYKEGLINKDNPIDETPEIMHFLIWHHDGRRWRMGASMMGPDYTHWNGSVDGIMNKFGTMINDLEMRRQIKELENKKKM